MDEPDLLGDVAISMETAFRQCQDSACVPARRDRLGLPHDTPWHLREEATFLLVHGLLHLLGHDHEEAAAEAEMVAEERRLMGLFVR